MLLDGVGVRLGQDFEWTAGLDLSNPIGMAAGFDKNAEVPKPLSQMGFGMVEIGL